MSSMSIKRYFGITMGLMGASLIGVAACIYGLNSASNAASSAQAERYKSFLLADELRQSSDDLTRLARTYVESGDAKWEQQYFEILDIRNGKRPRPAHYENIYWDFRAANIDPARGTEAAIPLNQLMKNADGLDVDAKQRMIENLLGSLDNEGMSDQAKSYAYEELLKNLDGLNSSKKVKKRLSIMIMLKINNFF